MEARCPLLTLVVGFVTLVWPLWAGAGVLGAWRAERSLPQARYGQAVVVLNGYLYVLGGHSGAGNTNTALFAKINEDGTLGEWQQTTPLPEAVTYHGAVVDRGFVYLVGAFKEGKAYFAAVNQDGTLGEWKETSPLPEPQSCGAVVAHNGFIYYLGGFYRRTVYSAPLLPGGGLGAWKETNHFISPRMGMDVFVINGFMYLPGGNPTHVPETASDIVFKCPVNKDGSLGKWKRDLSLAEPNAGYAGVLVKDRMILLGGSWQTGAKSAKARPDGSLEPWIEETPIPAEVGSFEAVFAAGRVYALGGLFQRPDGAYGVSASICSAPVAR